MKLHIFFLWIACKMIYRAQSFLQGNAIWIHSSSLDCWYMTYNLWHDCWYITYNLWYDCWHMTHNLWHDCWYMTYNLWCDWWHMTYNLWRDCWHYVPCKLEQTWQIVSDWTRLHMILHKLCQICFTTLKPLQSARGLKILSVLFLLPFKIFSQFLFTLTCLYFSFSQYD